MFKRNLVSILMPVYNEARTLERAIARVRDVSILPHQKELVIVDDGSTDGSTRILERMASEYPDVRALYHARNRGKGAALKTALAASQGGIILFQDADLEQDPRDYVFLLAALKYAHVVFGSRNLAPVGASRYPHYALGGRMVTALVNILFRARLTDVNSGYKALRREALRGISINADRFNFCEELTVKLLKSGVEIRELPISYTPRTFAEGKKIRALDGLRGLWTIVKYRFVD